MNIRKKLLTLLVMGMAANVYAVDSYDVLLTSKNSTIMNSASLQELSKHEKYIGHGQYNVQIGKHLSSSSQLRFNLLNESIEMRVDNINRKSENRLSYSAMDQKTGSRLHIAEHQGQVVGSLQVAGKQYKIRPYNGTTLITQVMNESLVDHGELYTEQEANIIDTSIPVVTTKAAEEITVIVAYTSEFSDAAGNISAYMDLLELETNTSYSNSLVDVNVRIVHSYETDYSESGDFYTDRSYFSDTSQAETQQLYSLRDQYNADIMMVLTGNDYSFCGIARSIGATADTALALARESCATGYYSFAHEIGHLFGARHIIYNDGNTSPFSYGHGYCNVTANTWRTVMAYGCPSNTGGPRIQQWSNPNVDINNEPTGTQDVEYNAKVLNVRAGDVANFR